MTFLSPLIIYSALQPLAVACASLRTMQIKTSDCVDEEDDKLGRENGDVDEDEKTKRNVTRGGKERREKKTRVCHRGGAK